MKLDQMMSLPEDEQKALFKKIEGKRHLGKSTNYAATYGAGPPTIARSAGVPEAIGKKLHSAYWEKNWSLKCIAEDARTKRCLGVDWLWNPVSEMWVYLKNKKDKFSTLNQSTGTYAFDIWVMEISKKLTVTAQFHDEVVIELSDTEEDKEYVRKVLKDAIGVVNKKLKLNVDLDCDVAFGYNYAEIH